MEHSIWEFRIRHVLRFSGHEDPFYHCKKIGLDFNLASKRKEKLDLQLLTNGAAVEVCDFANVLGKGKKHFILDILENNFDLFVDDKERSQFSTLTLTKANDLIKKPNQDKREVFILPGRAPRTKRNRRVSGPKSSGKEKKAQNVTTKSPSVEIDEIYICDSDDEDEVTPSTTRASAEESKRRRYPYSTPFCEEIGVKFSFGFKQRLNLRLLTKGVMLEIARFARLLCGSLTEIALDVLEHNFDLDFTDRHARGPAVHDLRELLKRKEQISKSDREMITQFEKEVFSFKINPYKRGRGAILYKNNLEGPAPKRPRKGQVNSGKQNDIRSKQTTMALSKPKQRVFQKRQMKEPKHVKKNKVLTETDVHTNQSVEQLAGQKASSTLTNEKMCPKAKNKSQDSVEHCFPLCKKIGLQLKVKFKPEAKKKIDLKLLTVGVVHEIHEYVINRVGGYLPTALYEILNYNFDLSSQNHRGWEFSLSIARQVQKMVRNYQENLDNTEEVFKLPFVFCSKEQKSSAKPDKDKNEYLEEPDSDCDTEDKGTQVRTHDEVQLMVKEEEEELSIDHGDAESSAEVSNATFTFEDPSTTEAEEAPPNENILQVNVCTTTGDCDRPLQDNASCNIHIKEEQYDPQYDDAEKQFYAEDSKPIFPSATPGLVISAVRSICQDTESKLTSDDTEGPGCDGDASDPEKKVDVKQEEDP